MYLGENENRPFPTGIHGSHKVRHIRPLRVHRTILKKTKFTIYLLKESKQTGEKGEIQKYLLEILPAYIYNNKIVVSVRVSNRVHFSENQKATNKQKILILI
jgi:hypothetical protein